MHKLQLNDDGLHVAFETQEELLAVAANLTNLGGYRAYILHHYPEMSHKAIFRTYAENTTRNGRLKMIEVAQQVTCSNGKLLMEVILEIKKPNPTQPRRDINLMM